MAPQLQSRISTSLTDVTLQQPVAVLGEGCGIPHRVLDAEADKPAKQQIIVDPLDQLPLRADRLERLQQHARISRSGGIDSRPIGEYSLANSLHSDLSAVLATSRITRSG